MLWAMAKFLTISLNLGWYGYGLNLFLMKTTEFPCLLTYGWITLTYFLIYSLVWLFILALIGGVILFFAIK